ncbi:HPr family phosphocarrier protein [Anaerovorax odorimutans]|uniref:HPr family phosphocarrier protein n=1 Tax=Anaerovorax odorimutans TaxID=109327 RepID=A0ABT1RSS2_9FIRM|nr:HPr family phosphocarrier protein [Anaerovorax odorimutans]MCQ4638257.1 HPr family phosphocarrier protein [Anaerovorax odorimutans]
MVSKKLKVTNSEGFHMRPATNFANAMAKYSSDIKIKFNNMEVNAKSVMNLIAACIKFGADIEIVCDGADEEAALQEAAGMIESGFGEE